MRKEFVTEEEIEKALAELHNPTSTDADLDDLLKAEEELEEIDESFEEFEKAEEEEEESPSNAKVEEEEEEDEDMDKGMMSCKGYDSCYKKGGMFYHKGKDGKYMEISKEEMEKYKMDEDKMEKGFEDEFGYADDEEFEKALEISPVLARMNEQVGEIEKAQISSNKAVGTILKGITEQLGSIQAQLDNFGKQTQGRKSMGVGSRDRFEEIEKGGEATESLSMTKDKNQILEILDEMTFAKGYDSEMSNALTYFEGNTQLSNSVISRIERERGVRITR